MPPGTTKTAVVVADTQYGHEIDELRNQQATIVAQLAEIKRRAEEEKRVMPHDEMNAFATADAELPRIATEIERLEREAQHEAAASFLHEAEAAVEYINRPRTVQYGNLRNVIVGRSQVMNDPKRGFKHVGEFADAVFRASVEAQIDERFMRYEAAMNFGSGADGGFLMPPEFSQNVWTQMNMDPVNLLQMCDVYPITGESLTLLANGEVSRRTGSRWGGIQGFWVEDGNQIQDTNPRVRRIRLEPHPLHVLVKVDNTLLRNPLAVERLLNQAAPEEIVFLVNEAIINGNRAGKPLGILSSAGRVTIAAESGQGSGSIVKANVDKMWARLHLRSRRSAQWFINQDVDPQLEALVAAGTTPAIPVFLPSDNGIPSIALAPNRLLKGRPILEIEQAQSIGTEGDIILGDCKAYAAGVRGTVESAMSMHLYFDRNQSAFRFTFYCDGQPWINQPLTPFNGTNTISAFVTLSSSRT